MIPSLVVKEIRTALVEYLATTFALSDDEVRDALREFLTKESEGIFRGPYLRVSTPFRQVEPSWQAPLDWLPDDFLPYQHQATAFERLSTASGHTPSPTLVTTGTGSGKTECFLFPILDHCARQRSEGNKGIKALLLYPMNALASDQAGRIAELIADEAALAGVTAGLYVGDQGRYSSMGPDHLIDKREVLRDDPPDILLTNYKMLDFLLLRQDDRDLWAAGGDDSLQYIVLDEFHTYDGAQGTDVAMLLRRLGATLKLSTPGWPLGTATPVATSATLGSGEGALEELRSFAGKVFGVDFDPSSVIGETRMTVDEACLDVNYSLPIPDVSEIALADHIEDVTAVFCFVDSETPLPKNSLELGEVLLAHPLTRAVLSAVGAKSRSWAEAVNEIVTRAPNWGRANMADPASVEQALAQYLRLLSMAERKEGDRRRPLFSMQVQLWVREVSRLLRTVSTEPGFRWRDSPLVVDEDGPPLVKGAELPAVYCRRCGMSGWMAMASETRDAMDVSSAVIYRRALERSPLVRTMLRAHPDDPDAQWYSPLNRMFDPSAEDRVPVLVTEDEDSARANRCPGCTATDTIRFLGLAGASLASVSINTLFGSEHLEDEERKLLAFTDSVQDASHRASFFGGRTHRINLRSLMSRIVVRDGGVSLADLGDLVWMEAATPRDKFGLVPPDLLKHPLVRTVWEDPPKPDAAELLGSRLSFEAALEFGLRARVGRTLELSRVAVASVDLTDADAFVGLLCEETERITGERLDAHLVNTYLRGLLERLRLSGGIVHPLLKPYVEDSGRNWRIWGGRPDGLPPFTQDQGRPTFFTTAPKGDFDSLTVLGTNPTWLVNWAVRVLGLAPGDARDLNGRTLQLLAKESHTVVAMRSGAHTAYGLDPAFIRVIDVVDEVTPTVAAVRCQICGHLHAVPPDDIEAWFDTPCLRYRCVGLFRPDEPRAQNYYRDLYRSGHTRRVVTAEHTGLLGRQAREDLEKAFKEGTAPNAPNVITATPTLEMGIDIGDLSAVMLTSVPRNPASYIQRVGRAGRKSGNSLVTTIVRSDTHGLYYLAEPEAMIAGDVRPPNCYLDAVETLQRQYVAYLVDRVADQQIDAPLLPREIGSLMKTGLDEGTFLRAITDASVLGEHATTFVELFGDALTNETKERLTEFASAGIEPALKNAVATWQERREDLGLRRGRLTAAIDRLEEAGSTDEDSVRQLNSLRGQRKAIVQLLRAHRTEYSLSALERLGVLPNYTLIDDAATLAATMWWKDDAGNYETEIVEYKRPGRLAIREFAPGNSFYAGGHRHHIDALEMGTAETPMYETWRLCPECGFGAIEPEGEPLQVCPRCAGQAIGDTGALHTMLRLSTALANDSEENARVFDESDDRKREQYDIDLIIDVEPAYISNAWKLADRTFGAELSSRTNLRTINFGFSERSGDRLPVAGQERHIGRFTVCRHCGAVEEARNDRDGTQPERLHQGWCKVRSKAVKPRTDSVLLLHELTTEAIRMVLPVSMFEVHERMASFKGALLLGLREDFGGDPGHLEVAVSDSPNRKGQGRRQFLVLFDNVPGGTGYLGRLADPERMRAILDAARTIISRCPCNAEGRSACHRCLLGVVDRHEYDLARRDLALEMLDDLLDEWTPEPVPSVADIDIGEVEESELERRFRVALQDWADRNPNEQVSLSQTVGRGRYRAWELRLEHDGERARYRIDEQEGLTTSPSTQPDFLIRREDDKGIDVAVYLDGREFHASEANNNIASDASKRAGVRASGMLVWNMVWDDVEEFHKAVLADPPRKPGPRALLKGQARTAARRAQSDSGGEIDLDDLNQNPVALLLDYLARPGDEAWQHAARSAVLGLFAAGDRHDIAPAAVTDVIRSGLASADIDVESTDEAVAVASQYITSNELKITAILDTREGRVDEQRWTVLAPLPDLPAAVASEIHPRRWRDWLQWSNVLQFVRGPGRNVIISAVSTSDIEEIDDLWLSDISAAANEAEPTASISEDMKEELDLLTNDEVKAAVSEALLAGAADFIAGDELDGVPLEAAWTEAKVAVLLPDSLGFSTGGWDARPVGEWPIDELIATLSERS